MGVIFIQYEGTSQRRGGRGERVEENYLPPVRRRRTRLRSEEDA